MADELRRFSRRRLLQAAGVGTAALAPPWVATAAPSTGAVSDVFRTGDRHTVHLRRFTAIVRAYVAAGDVGGCGGLQRGWPAAPVRGGVATWISPTPLSTR